METVKYTGCFIKENSGRTEHPEELRIVLESTNSHHV